MPSPVQTASGFAVSPATTYSVTFASNITAGNTVVLCGTPGTVTGSSDTYSSAVADADGNITIYYCLSSVGGYKTVTVNPGLGGIGFAYELPPLTAVDKTSTANSSTTTWTSGATGTTTAANEFWVGVGYVQGTGTITGPSSGGWTNLTAINDKTIFSGIAICSVSGYQYVASTGTATYSGTASAISGGATAGGDVATFKEATAAALAHPHAYDLTAAVSRAANW